MMSLAPEQQVPANPVSTIPPTTVADKHPVASERKSQPNVMPTTARSGRLVKPVPRLINLMMSQLVSTTKKQMNVEGELLSFATMTHEPEEMRNPLLVYKAVKHDILKLHEAMQAKDQKKFKAAMEKEVNNQIDNHNFSIIPQSQVPTGFQVFPGVWTLVRKHDILTREIKKYKARLAFDSSRMREGEDYNKTYAPVASWMSIHLLLTFVMAFGWQTQQVDYVAAYTQAPIDHDMYMEFLRGFKVPGSDDMLKSKLSRTDRQTFRPRFRWEMLIHIWISPRHWKDASGEKRSLESDTLYVFLCLETQVYKYIYVIVDHWFFWVTG